MACAPLIDRLSRRHILIVSLVLLALACALATTGSALTWILFCLMVGGATATLNPAISAMAADAFNDEATSARAATMVSATMTLTAMLAAPLLAGPALLWGWQGDLLATAVLCLLMASCHRGDGKKAASTPGRKPRHYLEALAAATKAPGAMPMLLASVFRTAAFMGQLAYIAVLYNNHFGLGSGVFSGVWTLSGLFFFLGNWFGGKILRGITSLRAIAMIALVSAGLATAAIIALFTSHYLAIALTMTALLAATHAVIAACVTTFLVRSTDDSRGALLALNGAGQSVGVFVGAGLGGMGLRVGGWLGAGLSLGAVTVVALVGCSYAAMACRRENHAMR